MVTESSASYPAFPPLQMFLDATERKVTDPPALSERDYVVRALAFANTTDPPTLHRLCVELVGGVLVKGHVYFDGLHAPLTPHVSDLRAEFERGLEVIRDDAKRARLELANTAWVTGARVAIRPSYSLTHDAVSVFYRHYPEDPKAALGYVLLLLLDPSRPYGRNLCRCKLSTCRRFFLAIKPKTGRTRREYCEQAHLEAARALDGAARVRLHRKRQRESARRGGARRTASKSGSIRRER